MRNNWVFYGVLSALVGVLVLGFATGNVQVVRKGPFCGAGFVKVSPWLGKPYCAAGYKP